MAVKAVSEMNGFERTLDIYLGVLETLEKLPGALWRGAKTSMCLAFVYLVLTAFVF